MKYAYHLIVAYLAVHFLVAIVREKSFWKQAGLGLALVVFLLRLFLVQ
jgi:undecaprenyl pyrophosphate phosphatase UppP